MPLNVADRVRETTTTTGTGTITLSGTSPTGYQTFSAVGNGNTTYYTINAGAQWEVGIGTYLSAGPTLSRDTVLASSNSGSLVDFAAGIKDVFCDYPASTSISNGFGTLPIANGGTGATSASAALTALGAYPASNPNGYTSNTGTVTSVNLTAGTGVSVSGGPITASGAITITNTAPDQVVALTGAGTTVVTGTYPNFTITSTDSAGGTVTSVAASGGTTGLSFTGSPITTSGTITLGGTLGVANGGTGASTFTNNALLKGAGTSALSSSVMYENGGYVGINVSGPVSLLDAQETLNGSGGISYINLSTGASSAGSITVEAGGSYFYHKVTRATGIVQFRGITATTLNQDFNTQVFRSTGGTEYMRLSSSGDMLLGASAGSGFGERLYVTTSNPTIANFYSTAANGGYVALSSGLGAYGLIGTATALIGSGGADALALRSQSLIAFATNGANERMRIDASGNVGIGTSSPSSFGGYTSLTVSNATNGGLVEATNGTRTIRMQSQASGSALVGTTTSHNLGIMSAGVERITVDTSGNVGVDTSSPLSKFHVNGSAAGGAITAFVTNTDATGFSSASFGDGANTKGQIWVGNASYASFGGAGSMNYSANSGPHVWYTNYAERMRIDSSGNVGIGTSSPGNKLSVNGEASFGASIFTGTGVSTGDCKIELGANRSDAGNAYIDFHALAGQDYNGRIIRYSGANGGFEINNTGTGSMVFSPNATERFRILSTGGITSSDLADAVGYKGLPQNSQTGAYTLALSDMGKHISTTTGGVVIPANGSVAFPIGATIVVFNNSGSSQTISITTDTLRLAGTATTGSRTLAQYGLATLVKVTSTVWVATGNVT